MVDKKKNVALYIRVSSDEQKKEGLSLGVQERRLIDYANNNEFIIFKIYKDEGISAKTHKGRKQFLQLLEDAKNKKFDAIIVTKLDRAWRSVKDAINTMEFLGDKNIDLISLSEKIDTTSAMGKFFFTVISAIAQLERDITGERNKDIIRDKFQRGIYPYPRTPVGYKFNKKKKIMEINNKQAEIVKEIYNSYSNGKSIVELTKTFNMGYQSIDNMIKNKVYIGIISFEGNERIGKHEPLISKELFNKVNKGGEI